MIPNPGVRRAVTVSSAASLAFALLLGALILRAQLRASHERSISEETQTVAEAVSNLVANDAYLPILDPPDAFPTWIQVIDGNQLVVARTPNVKTLTKPFAPVPAGNTHRVRKLRALTIDSGERVVVVTVPVFTKSQRLVVMVASPLDQADASDARVVRLLAMVFPPLVLVGAAIVWLTAQRALLPVQAITDELSLISSSDLGRRVLVPSSNDEIAHLAVTMNSMLDRLDLACVIQQRFVSDASHELRSPLASLRNQLEASLYDNNDPGWAETVSEMQIDHNRLERLVADLLMLARQDEGKRLVREPTDVGYLVRTEMTRRPVKVGIERIVEAQNVLVDGNTDALIRILRNLMDNAERHTSTYVRVTVDIKPGKGKPEVLLAVEDNGPGIAAEHREQIFDRFYRLDAARSSDAGGSGLGLAIVAELVADLDGTVAIEPANPGTRFVVTLPALRPSSSH
jgi:signal transduction histidine kinase